MYVSNQEQLLELFKQKEKNHSHIKGSFVCRVEIRVRQISIHLRINSGNSESYPRKHVIRRHPIDMILVDLGPYNHLVVVVIIFSPPAS